MLFGEFRDYIRTQEEDLLTCVSNMSDEGEPTREQEYMKSCIRTVFANVRATLGSLERESRKKTKVIIEPVRTPYIPDIGDGF